LTLVMISFGCVPMIFDGRVWEFDCSSSEWFVVDEFSRSIYELEYRK